MAEFLRNFRRQLVRHKATALDHSPYAANASAFDDRVDVYRNRTWFITAVAGVLLGVVLWDQVKYAEMVEKKGALDTFYIPVLPSGELGVPRSASTSTGPDDKIVRSQLIHLVQTLRTVTVDPIINRDLRKSSFRMITAGMDAWLRAFWRGEDEALQSDETRTVSITNAFKRTDATWELRWVEETYHKRVKSGERHATAIITVAQILPKSGQDVFSNPSQIYADNFQWNIDG